MTKKKEVIHKNVSSSVSHSIKKIKENERKYTTLLVLFFLIVFVFVGYQFLSVDREVLLENMKTSNASNSEIVTSFPLVFLTEENRMDDDNGLLSEEYSLLVENHTNQDIQYKIVFVPDEESVSSCGCQDRMFPISSILYSVDQETVRSFVEDNIVFEGTLEPSARHTIGVQMWLSLSIQPFEDYHFHGKFVLEEN